MLPGERRLQMKEQAAKFRRSDFSAERVYQGLVWREGRLSQRGQANSEQLGKRPKRARQLQRNWLQRKVEVVGRQPRPNTCDGW